MSLVKLKNNALDNLTSFEGSASLGDMVLVSSATASSSASIEFTLGDLKEYKFFFVNIHPASASKFTFNGSTDSGSNYNVTKTSTVFNAFHYENDAAANLNYDDDGSDIAQGTGFQSLTQYTPNADNDNNVVGTLQIFNPSSTTFVKHFISVSNMMGTGGGNPYTSNSYVAGYFNTTSALTNIKFQMISGNIDDGKILMFGLN